ncbi:hypothetical protein SLA2020_340780 [Shorea laevis]
MDCLRVLNGISDGLSRGKKPEEMEKLTRDLWEANMRHPQASERVLMAEFDISFKPVSDAEFELMLYSTRICLCCYESGDFFCYTILKSSVKAQRGSSFKAWREDAGVGLKLDDALAFWRAEFSQKDYTPYACQKIISSTPGVGDHHGCPYKHFGEENLRAAIAGMRVGSRAMEDIMDKVHNRH